MNSEFFTFCGHLATFSFTFAYNESVAWLTSCDFSKWDCLSDSMEKSTSKNEEVTNGAASFKATILDVTVQGGDA